MGLFITLIVTRSSLLIWLLTLVVVHTGLFVPFLLSLGLDIIFTSRVFNTLTLCSHPSHYTPLSLISVGLLPLFPFVLFCFQFVITQYKLSHFPTSKFPPRLLLGTSAILLQSSRVFFDLMLPQTKSDSPCCVLLGTFETLSESSRVPFVLNVPYMNSDLLFCVSWGGFL